MSLKLLPFASCLILILPLISLRPASSTRPAAGAKPAQHPTVEKYGGLIGNFIKQNYDRAMYFVAYSEVAILLWTILRAVT